MLIQNHIHSIYSICSVSSHGNIMWWRESSLKRLLMSFHSHQPVFTQPSELTQVPWTEMCTLVIVSADHRFVHVIGLFTLLSSSPQNVPFYVHITSLWPHSRRLPSQWPQFKTAFQKTTGDFEEDSCVCGLQTWSFPDPKLYQHIELNYRKVAT